MEQAAVKVKQNLFNCVVCSAVCSQCCSSCNKVAYCSKEHQKVHWKIHKPDCLPVRIQYNETVGRHLVATRDIKQGQLILKEKPLVTGPNCGATAYEKYHPLCLACFRIVKSNYACMSCKWPVCGLQCELMKTHTRNECPIFTKNQVAPFNANESFMYEKIIILRALLCKHSEPSTWKKLVDLESHATERSQCIKGVLLTHSAVEFIQETCDLQQQFTNEEIDHVVGALATNAFWNNDNTFNREIFRSGSYLYYYGSLPAHSCIPNSSWTIQMNSEFHLRASVDIHAGESITQLYTEATVGTLQRRSHLRETKYFKCTCTRCSDPTELQTYFSAAKCPSCPAGYLMPSSPLDEDSDWMCQSNLNSSSSSDEQPAVSCDKVMPRKYVEDLLQGIRTQINLANDDSRDDDDEKSSLRCINSLKELLLAHTQKQKTLHSNHFLIYEIENIIIQRISYLLAKRCSSIVTLDTKQISKWFQLATSMVALCRKVFRVTDVILPGFTTHRGRLLYFLQQGLITSLGITLLKIRQRNPKSKKVDDDNKSSNVDDAEATWREIENVRSEARQILCSEPEGREEFLLYQFLSQPSENLKFIQKKLTGNKNA